MGEVVNHLMSNVNTLLLSQDKETLYRNILEIATDLSSACQGSIMLMNNIGTHLKIVQTKGLDAEIARSLELQVGVGIAGTVAKSGNPLLVQDVEKDRRVAMPNRYRFKSKSLISVPLKISDKVIGVINLSDKANSPSFSRTDLSKLTQFTVIASMVIERMYLLEEARRLEGLSLIDHLTGIYNRRFLSNRMEEELNRSMRHGLQLSVLFIDLDHFKNYNDRYGHMAGDEALMKTTDIIKAALREMDIFVRYGGEEFCVLLPDTCKLSSLLVAERIRTEIEKERFAVPAGIRSTKLTVSLGIASFPEDGTTIASLIHASDQALYQAKANGRNCVVIASPTLSDPESEKRSTLGSGLVTNRSKSSLAASLLPQT